MSNARNESTAIGAAVDFALATVGVFLLVAPPVGILGSGFAMPAVGAAVLLSVAGAYPFAFGDWSLGRLGEFYFAFVACLLAAGAIAGGVRVAFGADLTTSSLPGAVAVLATYPGAYLLVTRSQFFGP